MKSANSKAIRSEEFISTYEKDVFEEVVAPPGSLVVVEKPARLEQEVVEEDLEDVEGVKEKVQQADEVVNPVVMSPLKVVSDDMRSAKSFKSAATSKSVKSA